MDCKRGLGFIIICFMASLAYGAADYVVDPGGSSGDIQYRDANGDFAGFGSFDSATNTTTLPGPVAIPGDGTNEFGASNFTGAVNVDGNVSATYYTGNGSLLTGIAAGYTNLTQFTAQTPWRVFYSNDTGAVIELALGADGTFLKSNGAEAAPTFDTPAGSGDMTKAVYDADEDSKVDAIEEALMIGANETYGSGWDADTGLPEKDDIYDYLYLLDTDDDGDIDTIDSTLWATKQAADADLTTYAGITPSANAQTLLAETFAQMQASLSVDDLITLSGVAEGSAHLATFTGSTINDNVTVKAALQALETAVEGKQATVTEGSLADSVIVSADIKDGEITAADTKITAGRSLTWSTDDIAADAELYTGMYNGGIYNVTTGDDAWVQIKPATAITISRISCSCDSGNVTIQFDERAEGTPDSAGTDVMSAALVCDTDTQATTSFDNAGIAADALINLDIDDVGGTPTKFRFHIDYTVDD